MGGRRDAEQVVLDMLDELCQTCGKSDAEGLRRFFTDDVVYHNMPMEPAVGLDGTIAFIEGFTSMFDAMVIETRHLAVQGDVVLTERVDTMTVRGTSAPLPVMGTFEVSDGRIRVWRDYFDMAQITKMLSTE